MQQVVVPQFLDVEDKIIGPVSVRQFVEMMIGAIIIAILYKLFDFPLFVISGLAIIAITLIVAFAKINGQSFHLFLLNFVQTIKRPKLKIWRKQIIIKQLKKELEQPPPPPPPPLRQRPVSVSKISEIALVIDTGGVYQGENGNQISNT
jgi:hypothetical protein